MDSEEKPVRSSSEVGPVLAGAAAEPVENVVLGVQLRQLQHQQTSNIFFETLSYFL
jgi:hypothetical protein